MLKKVLIASLLTLSLVLLVNTFQFTSVQQQVEPIILKMASRNTSLSSMLRTTTAPTMISSGLKANVLPGSATAVVNFRLLHGDTINSVISHVKTVINNPAIDVVVGGNIYHFVPYVIDRGNISAAVNLVAAGNCPALILRQIVRWQRYCEGSSALFLIA